ncbi:hypothetical protein HK097_011014, partial [Rhizophlyctis rosea]
APKGSLASASSEQNQQQEFLSRQEQFLRKLEEDRRLALGKLFSDTTLLAEQKAALKSHVKQLEQLHHQTTNRIKGFVSAKGGRSQVAGNGQGGRVGGAVFESRGGPVAEDMQKGTVNAAPVCASKKIDVEGISDAEQISEKPKRDKGKKVEGTVGACFGLILVPLEVAPPSKLRQHVFAALPRNQNVFINDVIFLGEVDGAGRILVRLGGPVEEIRHCVESYESGVYLEQDSEGYKCAAAFLNLQRELLMADAGTDFKELNSDAVTDLRGGCLFSASVGDVNRHDEPDEDDAESGEVSEVHSDGNQGFGCNELSFATPGARLPPPNPLFFKSILANSGESVTDEKLLNDRCAVAFGDVLPEQIIFTDGCALEEWVSCIANMSVTEPVKVATFAIVDWLDQSRNFARVCSIADCLSGIAELEGVVVAVEEAPDHIFLRIFVDCVSVITKLANAVKFGIGHNSREEDVNALLRRFVAALARKQHFGLYIQWVKGHASGELFCEGNRLADKLAGRLARDRLAVKVNQKLQNGWTN